MADSTEKKGKGFSGLLSLASDLNSANKSASVASAKPPDASNIVTDKQEEAIKNKDSSAAEGQEKNGVSGLSALTSDDNSGVQSVTKRAEVSAPEAKPLRFDGGKKATVASSSSTKTTLGNEASYKSERSNDIIRAGPGVWWGLVIIFCAFLLILSPKLSGRSSYTGGPLEANDQADVYDPNASIAAPAFLSEPTIYQGIGVGAIKLGNSEGDVLGVWGEPAERTASDNGFDVWEYRDEAGGASVVFQADTNSVVGFIVANNSFQLDKYSNVRPGASINDIEAILGKPNSFEYINESGRCSIYLNLGLTFYYNEDDKCTSIYLTVSKKEESERSAPNEESRLTSPKVEEHFADKNDTRANASTEEEVAAPLAGINATKSSSSRVESSNPQVEPSDPQEMLGNYYKLIDSKNFNKAYKLRSRRSHGNTSIEVFKDAWANNNWIYMSSSEVIRRSSSLTELKVRLVSSDLSNNTGAESTTEWSGVVRLVLEDNIWRYDGGDFEPLAVKGINTTESSSSKVESGNPQVGLSDPQEMIGNYYKLIDSKSFGEAYKLRSRRSRGNTSIKVFEDAWANNNWIRVSSSEVIRRSASLTELKVRLVSSELSKKTGAESTTEWSGVIRLVLEDNIWRYDGGDFEPLAVNR